MCMLISMHMYYVDAYVCCAHDCARAHSHVHTHERVHAFPYKRFRRCCSSINRHIPSPMPAPHVVPMPIPMYPLRMLMCTSIMHATMVYSMVPIEDNGAHQLSAMEGHGKASCGQS